jgi:hypothetical protein
MNFEFSRDYGECRGVQSTGVCCYSNTDSADVLLQQQGTVQGIVRHI